MAWTTWSYISLDESFMTEIKCWANDNMLFLTFGIQVYALYEDGPWCQLLTFAELFRVRFPTVWANQNHACSLASISFLCKSLKLIWLSGDMFIAVVLNLFLPNYPQIKKTNFICNHLLINQKCYIVKSISSNRAWKKWHWTK